MELKNLPNQEDIYDLDTDDLRSLIQNIQTQINQNYNQEQKLNKLNRLLELSQIELSERENVENFGNLINLMGDKNQQYQNNNQQQNFNNYYDILNQNNARIDENQQQYQNIEKQSNQLKNTTPVKNNINTFDNIKAWEEFQLEFSEDKENKNKETFLNNDPSQQEIENYNKKYNLQYKKLTDKKQNQNQAQIQTNLKSQEQNINNQKLSPIKNISYISNKSNQTSQEKSDKKKNLKNKSKSPISQSQKYQNTISHQQNTQAKYNQYNVKKFNSLKYGKDGIIIKEIYKPGNYQDLFSEDDITDQQNIEKQQQKQENSQFNSNIFKASSEDETTSLSHSGNTNFSNQKRNKNKNKSFLPPIENNKKSLNVKHHSYDNNSKQSQEFQESKNDINIQYRDSHSSQSQTTQISNLNIEVSGHHKELFDQRSSFDKSSIASKDQSVSSRYSGNTKSLAQIKKQQDKNKEKKELMSQFIKETLQRTRVEGPVSMGKGSIGKYIPKEKTEVEPHMKSRFVVMTDKQQSNLEKQKGSREQYKVESKLKQDLQKRKIEQQQKIDAQGYISLGKPKVSFKYIPKTKPKESNNNKKRPNSQQKHNTSQNASQNLNQQNRRNSYINKKDQQSNKNIISKKIQDSNSNQQKQQQQVLNDKLKVEKEAQKNQQQQIQQKEVNIQESNNQNVELQIKSDLIINNEHIQQESQQIVQKNENKIQDKPNSQLQEINKQNQNQEEDYENDIQTIELEQKKQNKVQDNFQQEDNNQGSEKRKKIKQNLNKKLLQNNNSIIEEQDEKFEDSYQNYSIENPIKAKSQQKIENEQLDNESEQQIEQKDRDEIKTQDEDLDTNEFLNQENIEQNQKMQNKNDDLQNQINSNIIDSENNQAQNEFLDDQQGDNTQQSENNVQQQGTQKIDNSQNEEEVQILSEKQVKDSDTNINSQKNLTQAEYIQNLINTINFEKQEEKQQVESNDKSKNDPLQKNEIKLQKDLKKDENLNKNINYSPKSEKEQKILQNMLNQIQDPTIKEIMEKKLRSISQQQYQKQLQQEQENNKNNKNTQNKQEQNQSNEINTQPKNQTIEKSEKQGMQNQQQQQESNTKNSSRPPSNYQNKGNKQLPPTQKNPAPKGKQNIQQKQQVSQQKKQIQKMEKILASQPLKQDYTQYFTDFRQIFSYFYNKNISKNGNSGSHQFTSALLQNNNNNQNLQKQNGRQQIYISDKCFLNNQNQNQQLVSEFADNLMELAALFKYYAEKSQEKNFYTPESQILLTPFDLQKSESYYVNDPNQVRIYANRVEIDIKRFIDRQILFSKKMQFQNKLMMNQELSDDELEKQKAECSDIPKKVFRVVKTKSDTYDIITRGFMRKDNWLQLPTGKGLRFTWNLLWTFSRPEIEMEKLLIFQKLNHFPGNRNLHRKDLIFQNIQRAQKISPQANKYFADIMPLTFLLPKEYLQFSERFQRDKNIEGDYNIWIMKPLARSQGKGISLINDISNVVYAEQMIVQKYLKKPLLIDNFKFDLRIYALVTSYNPLECFIFKEGFARISTEEFSLHPDDITNNQIHLTNYSIQKHFYDHTSMKNYIGGTKISLKMLKQRFLQQWDKIWNQIKEIIVKLLVCVQPEIPYNPNCFELYGFDVIIDSNFNCQILEVNTSPSLNRDFILDDLIKQQLIDDSLDLVNPIGFDHKRLAEVLERRLKDEQDKNTNYQDKDLLNKDLNYILKGQKIRQYGELPEKMGDFEMIAPGPILDQALKMTQKINKLSQK